MCKVNSSLYYVQKAAAPGRQAACGQTHWIPNTDVYVTDSHLVIKVELAGMRREDLELTVEGNRLMISGQRPDGGRGARCKFLVMEINYGAFECVIEIPEGYDLGQAKAAYQNGFLRVDVPQALRSSKPVLVPISEEQ
jgi:HSP20 family protein